MYGSVHKISIIKVS